ncbi:dTDP-4-dehydrorhamnose reductase [Caldisericum sp.]|jgi:dTDP-4-dehydrorhamnose reductase|uniref:dTDP-4-dehydrorhamnose reductase n=1 Tax=Caldisericum sp. TaxID=2499687 RepID=UPI003D1040D4
MKIIILGAKGQLGREFEEYLKEKAEIHSFSHSELDVLNQELVIKKFQEIKPDVVINCSAYTKVDKAEEDKEECIRVNAEGAKNVSYASYKVGAKVIYFSTDYVFDGEKGSSYTELDSPNPLSTYGRSKLLGEIYTKDHNPNFLILRISWLYGIYGRNFVKTIINKAKKEKELRIVNDQIGSPTYTLDVVKQTWKLIQMDKVGLYHSANQGETTWYEFTKRIIEKLNLNVKIYPIKTEEYPVLAQRPKYSALDNYLLKLGGINMMGDWESALSEFLTSYSSLLIKGGTENE